MKVNKVQILHPEGSFLEFVESEPTIQSIRWHSENGVTVRKTNKEEFYYPVHRVHKIQVKQGDS